MTCIAGLVADDGTVYMGADSAGVSGTEMHVLTTAKVFRNGPYLIGASGSFRFIQLLRWRFQPPLQPEGMDTERFLNTVFVDALRDCLKESGWLTQDKDRENGGGYFLLGYRGHLYCVESDFQVNESEAPFKAIGCGGEVARGALHAMTNTPLPFTPAPHVIVRRALEAAEALSSGVRRPFHILMLEAGEATEELAQAS